MRFDLKVPFAEKDEAKKLGARWDPARKLWYVKDREDMAPFARWSPVAGNAAAAGGTAAAAPRQSAGTLCVGTRYVEVARVCECLPWEDCDRCRGTGFPA